MTSWYHEARVFASAMSSISGQGAGSTSDDMLTAIFKQLATMDALLQSMETKLHNVNVMQAMVWRLRSCPEPGGGSWSNGTRGGSGATLCQKARAGATGRVAAPELP
jgi:hypothetical protein